MIKVIAFDFGGVIFTYNHSVLMETLSKKLNLPIRDVTNAWKIKIKDYELGKISENEFWNLFLKRLNKKYNKKILHLTTINHFKPIRENIKLLLNLRNKFIIGLISNQTSWIEDLERKYKFKRLFNILVISREVSLRKPQKSIFKLFIKKSKVTPKEIIFIDDMLSYKKYTIGAGINFIHYKSPKKLRTALKKFL